MWNFRRVSFACWHPASIYCSVPGPHFFWLGKAAPRFGNLIETMISLWSAVSGGNDWMNYGELLRCGKLLHGGVSIGELGKYVWQLGSRRSFIILHIFPGSERKGAARPKSSLKHDAKRSHFCWDKLSNWKTQGTQHTEKWCRIKDFSKHRMW